MPRPTKNLLGQTFGKRKVIARAPQRRRADGSTRTFWRCLCVCGKVQEIGADLLLAGGSQSCENCRLQKPDALQREVYRRYRMDALRRDIVFGITFLTFLELTAQPCFYCGRAPFNRVNRGARQWWYSGIDRFDNNTPYMEENCVACCTLCNRAKATMNGWEFIELCRLVANLHRSYS